MKYLNLVNIGFKVNRLLCSLLCVFLVILGELFIIFFVNEY